MLNNFKAISRSTLGMHLVSGCVLVPPLRKPGTEGLSLIGETDMFPAGASFTSGSFATSLAMLPDLDIHRL